MATPMPRRRPKESAEMYEKRTSERLWMVCTGIVAGHALVLGSLYRVQIARHKELSAESKLRWQHTDKKLYPTRGLIYDRNRNLLVQNEEGFSVVVDPNEWLKEPTPTDSAVSRRARVLKVLQGVFPQEDFSDLETLDLSKIPDEPFAHHDVRNWVSEAVVEKIHQAAADESTPVRKTKGREKGSLPQAVADLPGVGFARATRRAALNGTLAAHVIGFTDQAGKQAWRGLEASQNKYLAGEIGQASYQFDLITMIPGTTVFQKKQVNGVSKPAQRVHGSHLVLTLDSELQHDAEKAIAAAVKRHKAESGVAVIMDAQTGEVLAMASAPTYNVNAARTLKNASAAEVAARANWATENPYEPGSTLKTFTLAAALEEQKVSLNSMFYCNGLQKIGKDSIHCAPHGKFLHGHLEENLTQVLANSCNLATAHYGKLLGQERLYHYFTEVGLGTRTGIGLSESPGKLIDPDDEPWKEIEVANRSFGQGISVTPLQLAAAYTVFVDGQYRAPRLIHAIRHPETNNEQLWATKAPKRVFSEKTAEQMRGMLGSVVEHGTGMLAQLNGYSAGGKTGTAQISDKGHYRGRYVASFVGLAPLEKPEFVILTLVRDPKAGDHYGGSVAGPIFKELAEKALLQRRVQHNKLVPVGLDPQIAQQGKVHAIE